MDGCLLVYGLKHDANATQPKWIAHSTVVCSDINHGFPFKWKKKKPRENNKQLLFVVLMRALHFTTEQFVR